MRTRVFRLSVCFAGFLATAGFIQMLGCTPVLPGGNPGGGPIGGGGTTLLNQTVQCNFDANGFCGFQLAFNPTQAGRTVAVNVTASLTASRTTYVVADVNGNVVSNVDNPTTNISSSSFVTQNASQHVITVTERVNAASTYTVQVTQN